METLILLLIAFLILVQFLLTMSKCLSGIAPAHRTISRANLWWNMVPIFNMAWLFVTAVKFAESVNREARAREVRITEAPLAWGITSAALFTVFMLTALVPVAATISFGLWIFTLAMYWKCVAKLLVGFSANRFPKVR